MGQEGSGGACQGARLGTVLLISRERVRGAVRPMKVPSPPPRHVREPAPDPLGFRFRSGESARSLEEFEAALRRAPADALMFHREHFVPWLRDVVRDDPLARRVESYAQEARDGELLREILVDLVGRRLAQLDVPGQG